MFGKNKNKSKNKGKKPTVNKLLNGTTIIKNVPVNNDGVPVGQKKQVNRGRTASGKVPRGRTLSTRDKYLDKKAKQPNKERPVVVIEASDNNDLAVVPMSSTAGKNKTHLPKYQQGQSYYKHYVEIMDDEGNPIRVNDKFKENHPNMDVSAQDVEKITDKVLNHSKPMQSNRKKNG